MKKHLANGYSEISNLQPNESGVKTTLPFLQTHALRGHDLFKNKHTKTATQRRKKKKDDRLHVIGEG